MVYREVLDEVASTRQVRLALFLTALVVVGIAVATPYAALQLPALPHVTGMYGAAAAMINLATFWLLVSAPRRPQSHTIIAAAYLFSGLMAVVHVLTFPGAVLADGPVIGSPHAVSWLYIVWRAGFAALIGWAAVVERPTVRRATANDWVPLVVACLGVACAFAMSQATDVAALLSAGDRQLFSDFSVYGSYASAALALSSILLIWRRRLYRRAIFVWLVFVLAAEACAVWFSTFSGARYTLAWYTARVEGVISSAAVLVLLGMHFRSLQRGLLESVETLKSRTDELQTQMHKRQSAEAELARARRLEALGRLGAGLSHDLNNILQVITGRLAILQRRTGEAVERDVDVIRRSVKKAETLTRQLTLLSGRRQFEPEPLSLQEVLPRAVANARQLVGASHLVDVEIASDLPLVAVDPLELEIAVSNLATNARDAMASGGRISVRAYGLSASAERAAGVVLEVADEGTGIKGEFLEHIFEPFFTTKEPGKGTGLGLAQVYGLAKASGATVDVETTVGVGTKVKLLFPAHREQGDRDAAPRQVPPTTEPVDQVVLLVDDNDEVRDSSHQLLASAGFVVRSAGSAAEALQLVSEGLKIDVLVSDIVMPGGMHGVELARRVRRHTPAVRVVLVTGYADIADGARDDDFAVLRKPYELAALLSVLGAKT